MSIELYAPVGTGINSNSSSSLTPNVSSICSDSTLPGQIYVGDGSIWRQVPSYSTYTTTSSAGISVTATVQYSQQGTTQYYKYTYTSGGTTYSEFSLTLPNSITTYLNLNFTATGLPGDGYYGTLQQFIGIGVNSGGGVTSTNAYTIYTTTSGLTNFSMTFIRSGVTGGNIGFKCVADTGTLCQLTLLFQ